MLLANLEEEQQLGGLLSSVDNYLFEPGSTLFRMGDPATSLYSLRKGVVSLEILDDDSEVRILLC